MERFSLLVKWSCGCIGFHPSVATASDGMLLLKDCTSEWYDDPVVLFSRDMGSKTYEPLTETAQRELLEKLRELVADGFKFREIRKLLKG